MADGIDQLAPAVVTILYLLHPVRGYRVSGCVFVQPESVFPGSNGLASRTERGFTVGHRSHAAEGPSRPLIGLS